MTQQLLFEPAYLLHARPYRNTSVLADFFTLNYGRVNGVVRGARGERSKIKAILQPFMPLLIIWRGNGDLVGINKVELADSILPLNAECIAFGFYLNELLVRLLRVRDAHQQLYQAYVDILNKIRAKEFSEIDLRLFEKKLLTELGYSMQLAYETETGDAVDTQAWYHFIPDKGPVLIKDNNAHKDKAFIGESLLALHDERLHSEQSIRDAKRLMRRALRHLLGDKPLKTRELFFK